MTLEFSNHAVAGQKLRYEGCAYSALFESRVQVNLKATGVAKYSGPGRRHPAEKSETAET